MLSRLRFRTQSGKTKIMEAGSKSCFFQSSSGTGALGGMACLTPGDNCESKSLLSAN